MRVVAFQGERGAHSEDAVTACFGADLELLPCRTLHEAFAAVEEGRATEAVVPAENSRAGTIHETFDLLVGSPLQVASEVDVRVTHTLQALPGQSLAEVQTVYSHPQALSQCERFLRNLGAEAIAVYDTAGGAKMIAERNLRGCAAIASARAATHYGLEVLASGIEDDPGNTTKFYMVAPYPGTIGDYNRTVLVMATAHRPGALYWCLGALAYRGINLVKLESRPSRRRPWEYLYYLVFEGHIDDVPCREAIQELDMKTTFLRVLGSYACARPENPAVPAAADS